MRGNVAAQRRQAKLEIAAVEAALRAGHPPHTTIGSHIKVALRVAAEAMGIEPQSLRRRIGTPEFPGAWFRRLGLKPDWSVYVPPELPPVSIAVARPGVVEEIDEAAAAEEAAKATRRHAQNRAEELKSWITTMLTSTRYPVINPEAIVVEARVDLRYQRDREEHVEVEGAPRTWISDLLRVAPIPDPRGRTFIFTGAQNDAIIHEPFWNNLKAYAEFLGAEIIVGPWTYETAWFNESHTVSRSYDERILDHICFGQMKIGDHFLFCGEMNTLPTASRPISDLVTHSRGLWAVFPHAKLQLKSVPSTDPTKQAHQVMTSGAVTLPKVIPRKAGVRSIFHHIIGATVVEFDSSGDLFCRQINATDDRAFYDLDRRVENETVTTGHRIRALVCGDIHVRKLDPANALATFGLDILTGETRYLNSVVDVLRPEYIFLHDVFDNEARNHHHVDDSAYSYEMAIRGRDRVMAEVSQAADFLAGIRRPDTRTIVVDSNHDLGLERYVREGRYRKDGANSAYGLHLETAYMEHRKDAAAANDRHETPPTFSMFEYAARATRSDNLNGIEWVHDGQSFIVDEIQCGHHGFRGANGSRGTVSGYARIGRKMSIGDKHSPEILEGVYCAGCMNLRQGYNKGPSSWAISHIMQYQNGKRAIITLQSGKWRAERPRVRVRARAA